MTPQERELITALLARMQQQANQPKDAEAEALIRQGMAAQPDAPYLLVQTVLIQDMALHSAQERITALEQQVAAKAASPQPTSFLGGHGSVPAAGPWQRSTPSQAQPAAAPVWSGGSAAAPMASAPQMLAGGGSGFLRQAAMTAAGIAGGALLFEGIQSMFGAHAGGGFLAGAAAQPGISETVVNNYYGDGSAPAADSALDQSGAGQGELADDATSDQDMADTDIADAGDFDGGGGSFDA